MKNGMRIDRKTTLTAALLVLIWATISVDSGSGVRAASTSKFALALRTWALSMGKQPRGQRWQCLPLRSRHKNERLRSRLGILRQRNRQLENPRFQGCGGREVRAEWRIGLDRFVSTLRIRERWAVSAM